MIAKTTSSYRRCSYRSSLMALVVVVIAVFTPVAAQERDDTRRVLEQSRRQQDAARERALLQAAQQDADGVRPTITIDGASYTVGKNVDELGQALYLALQAQHWQAAAQFLAEYLTLPGREVTLVHYAQGALARVAGDYRQAEREYRALLVLQPQFLPGRLELARVLFEDQQDNEADALFAAIQADIDAADAKTAGVRASIGHYRQALAQRLGWSGTLSFGPTWSDNVNRTSASRTCLWQDEDGFCFIERTLPTAIRAFGLDFDVSLGKRFAWRGHHGVSLHALAFGQSHRHHSVYNELNATVQAGYSYRNARHALMLGPSFDYYALGNHALFGAWGAHGEWSWTLSPQSLLKLEADWKDHRYRQAPYALAYDGIQRSLAVTYFRSLSARWTMFGGVDLVDSRAPDPADAHRARGLRAGASLQWPQGFTGTVFASYRKRRHTAESIVLEGLRKDDEQNYTLVVNANRWAFAGFTPVLSLRHVKVASSIDWLHTYDKNSVSLKLERSF